MLVLPFALLALRTVHPIKGIAVATLFGVVFHKCGLDFSLRFLRRKFGIGGRRCVSLGLRFGLSLWLGSKRCNSSTSLFNTVELFLAPPFFAVVLNDSLDLIRR